jgi:hypothetical protein
MPLKKMPSGDPPPGPEGAILVEEWVGDVKKFFLQGRALPRLDAMIHVPKCRP